MDLYNFLIDLRAVLSFPAALLFFAVAIFLTFKTKFIQFRAFKHFVRLIAKGLARKEEKNMKAINPFHALFTSMSTTIGMGNVVAPPLAIVVGGPGALFWLFVYCVFASVTKFVEVTLAVHFRTKTKDGSIIGGPPEYLKKFSCFIGSGYGFITIFLFAAWSALQANGLSEIFSYSGVPAWITGLGLALLVFCVLIGGAKRIGVISSRLVPSMFVIYISCSLFILLKNPSGLADAFVLIYDHIFSSVAPVGGFAGAAVYVAMREGISKGVYVTECGVGTSSVAHSIADVKKPTDQGILALYSVAADLCLCLVSGLLVLVTNVWETGEFSNMLMFKVFDMTIPHFGYFILLATLFLFILTTLIGNSFNGSQSFASFTRHRFMMVYYIAVSVAIFFGAIIKVPLMWAITDLMIYVISIPHLIGISFLACRYGKILIFKEKTTE